MMIIGITGKAGCGKDTMVVEYFKRPDHPLALKREANKRAWSSQSPKLV